MIAVAGSSRQLFAEGASCSCRSIARPGQHRGHFFLFHGREAAGSLEQRRDGVHVHAQRIETLEPRRGIWSLGCVRRRIDVCGGQLHAHVRQFGLERGALLVEACPLLGPCASRLVDCCRLRSGRSAVSSAFGRIDSLTQHDQGRG